MDSKVKEIMNERFGHDTVLSVATVEGNKPYVRVVNSFYDDGAFYVVTYALSRKIQQISENPTVAVCGEWFSAHGKGENLGWVLDEKNKDIMTKVRSAFSEWYSNGHTDESDKNTCLLKIVLTDGILLSHGTRYDVDFTEK